MPHRAPSPALWVVDDDDEFRALAIEVARSLGLTPQAFHPKELGSRLASGLPDAVMLDRAITHDGGASALVSCPRIVLCTARTYGDLPEEWVKRDNVRVLLKPFDLSHLEAALRWLAGGPDRGDWETPPPE